VSGTQGQPNLINYTHSVFAGFQNREEKIPMLDVAFMSVYFRAAA
jgi:hypothetical protein